MNTTILYTFGAVILVSLVSLVGILYYFLSQKVLDKVLLLFVSLSAGSLLGGAFFHLLPEVVEEKGGMTISISLSVVGGILLFFLLEKYIHWHHCHKPTSEDHPHHLAVMNLVGDGVHNLVDGLIIAGSFLASIPTGIATTLAVILHEVPQEIGDFGVLVYSGISKARALFFNFISALLAVLGAGIGLMLGSSSEMFVQFILPFAAGGFIYVAGTDLIPELHKGCGVKERYWKDSFWHFLFFILGIVLALGLVLME